MEYFGVVEEQVLVNVAELASGSLGRTVFGSWDVAFEITAPIADATQVLEMTAAIANATANFTDRLQASFGSQGL